MPEFLKDVAFYYVASAILSFLVLFGISRMSKVETAVRGNALGALSMLLAIVLVLWVQGIVGVMEIWIGLALGSIIGFWLSVKVKMIQMPETVGLLNGFGGAASMIVGLLTLLIEKELSVFAFLAAGLAVFVGGMTFMGSVIAAAKLAKWIPGRPRVLKHHPLWSGLTLVVAAVSWLLPLLIPGHTILLVMSHVLMFSSLLFGYLLAIRVGGADMPITISLLNSFSGVAGSIAGLAISDVLLVAVGGIVGASGLLLTQIMCRAMNRHLMDILLGQTSMPVAKKVASVPAEGSCVSESSVQAHAETVQGSDVLKGTALSKEDGERPKTENYEVDEPGKASTLSPMERAAGVLAAAQRVILVPGYGMALSQAQAEVQQLMTKLENDGKSVRFAIHPVAGRMPGHMNVLLAEVDVPYEKLCEMDEINDDFADTDCVVVVGANDVMNPAANTAEGTPIYGMPILEVAEAKHILVFNYDLQPGYAGVPNPLYSDQSGKVDLLLGDAKEQLKLLLASLRAHGSKSGDGAVASATEAGGSAVLTERSDSPDGAGHEATGDLEACQPVDPLSSAMRALTEAQTVILVPGYGMALAQAQREVKEIQDRLESAGKRVRFAIHPVAGRMPGHMNVLLAEVDVPYEMLCEMDEINPAFAETDCVLIVGANDVVNPAANTAEGTPIYGMPVLDVHQARHVVICNYDTQPGYAGVPNPLYQDMTGKVDLLLGDAKAVLRQLLDLL